MQRNMGDSKVILERIAKHNFVLHPANLKVNLLRASEQRISHLTSCCFPGNIGKRFLLLSILALLGTSQTCVSEGEELHHLIVELICNSQLREGELMLRVAAVDFLSIITLRMYPTSEYLGYSLSR